VFLSPSPVIFVDLLGSHPGTYASRIPAFGWIEPSTVDIRDTMLVACIIGLEGLVPDEPPLLGARPRLRDRANDTNNQDHQQNSTYDDNPARRAARFDECCLSKLPITSLGRLLNNGVARNGKRRRPRYFGNLRTDPSLFQ
jgi:hypothetical protein